MRWSFFLTGLLLYSLWITAYFIPTTQTFQSIRAFMKSMTLTDYVLAGVGLLLGVLLLYYFMGKLHKFFYGY
jgi:Na+/phosphate symporter